MKIYLVGFYDDASDFPDAQCIAKAVTSYECARRYVLDAIDGFKTRNSGMISDVELAETESKYAWELRYKRSGFDRTFSHVYRIEPVDLEESADIPPPARPELEKRCEALTRHNDELKSEIAELRAAVGAARCFLTFWDGGKYEDLEHLLGSIRHARRILDRGKSGNSCILKPFENWKKRDSVAEDA